MSKYFTLLCVTLSLQIDYLTKLLQLLSNKVGQTNIDLGFGEIDAGIFFWHNYTKNKQKQPSCKMSTVVW